MGIGMTVWGTQKPSCSPLMTGLLPLEIMPQKDGSNQCYWFSGESNLGRRVRKRSQMAEQK